MARCLTLLLAGLLLLSCALTGSDGTDLGMTAQDMSIEPVDMRIGPVDMGTSVPPLACIASAWRLENPLPTGHSLHGVWGVDASSAWAVGLCGTIVSTMPPPAKTPTRIHGTSSGTEDSQLTTDQVSSPTGLTLELG